MHKFIRKALRLIAQWWEMIKERDERIGHQRFIEDTTRERDVLRWQRALLIEELTEIAYRHAASPVVCRNQPAWELEPTRSKLQRIDGCIEALEHQVRAHALLCNRSGPGQTQAVLR